MKIKIIRRYTGKTCVIGKFKVFDDDDKLLLECFSLEEDKEGVERNKDLRIPEGIYDLKRHSPSRFENTLRSITKKDDDTMINVYNDEVPASRAILIHWGNTDKDTQGCILLGLTKIIIMKVSVKVGRLAKNFTIWCMVKILKTLN